MITTQLLTKGTIVRYAAGPTALMRIDDFFPGHGGSIAYYGGEHCLGGTQMAYHEKIERATAGDLDTWYRCKPQRLFSQLPPLSVFVCSNPKCGAIFEHNPEGHCPDCIQPDGAGFSTVCRSVRRYCAGRAAEIRNEKTSQRAA